MDALLSQISTTALTSMPTSKEKALVSNCTLNDSFLSPLPTSEQHHSIKPNVTTTVAKIGTARHQVRDLLPYLSSTLEPRFRHNELTRSLYESIADSAEIVAYNAQLIAARFPGSTLSQVALRTARAALALSLSLSPTSPTTTSSGSPAAHRLRHPDV